MENGYNKNGILDIIWTDFLAVCSFFLSSYFLEIMHKENEIHQFILVGHNWSGKLSYYCSDISIGLNWIELKWVTVLLLYQIFLIIIQCANGLSFGSRIKLR